MQQHSMRGLADGVTGNCYEGVGIWVVHEGGLTFHDSRLGRDLGNLGDSVGVCQD